MKLDTSCIREVLLKVEELQRFFINYDGDIEKEPLSINSLYDALPKYEKEDVFYAVYNLEQAGYLDVSVQWSNDSVSACAVNHMTYAGHQFLETVRDPECWRKTKQAAGKIGNFSLKILETIAQGVAEAFLDKVLPTII